MAGHKKWFRLDNAALLYPAVASFRWSSGFRMSASLKDPVDPTILTEALRMTLKRFPTLKVRIRSGFFWHYLEEIPEFLTPVPEAGHPCYPFRLKGKPGHLLRVLYRENRISVEFFHSLTDGTGGLMFLKTLVVQYLRLSGRSQVRFDHGALDPSLPATAEETRDEFVHMDLPRVRVSRTTTKAWHYPATRELPYTLNTIAASADADRIAEKARSYGVSVTVYLTSVLLYTAMLAQKASGTRRQKPLRVSVPINMRRFVSTRTVRNFSSFVNPGIDPVLGEYTFPEICRSVKAFMAYFADPKLLKATIATNVGDQKHPILRLAPLFIKDLCISSVFRRTGEKLFTTTLSNLGVIEFPTGTEAFVESFEFQLGGPGRPGWNVACSTCGNALRLLFSGTCKERELPRDMLRFLVEEGIPVSVESNDEE